MRMKRSAAALVAALLTSLAFQSNARADEQVRVIVVGAEEEAGAALQRGRSLLDAGKPKEAAPHVERAVKLLEVDAGSHPRALADALLSRAAVREALAQHDQADIDLFRATNLYTRVFGPESTMVAATMRAHGVVRSSRGDRKQALELFQGALAIAEKTLPPSSELLADFLQPLADELLAAGDVSGAAPLLARAIGLRDTPTNKDPLRLAVVVESSALLQARLGNDDKALALFRWALELRKKALGPDHVRLATTMHSIAVLRGEHGAIDEAMDLERQAIALIERSYGLEHPALIQPLENMAMLHLKRIDVDASCDALERSNDIAERNLRLILGGGSERETLAYLSTIRPRVDQRVFRAARLVSRHGRSVRAALTAVLRYKGRALDVLANNLETIRRRQPPEKQRSIDELREAQAALARLTMSQIGADKPDLAAQKRLTERIERGQSWVASLGRYFRAEAATVTFDSVQAAIPRGAALVELYAYDEPHARAMPATRRYAAFVVRPSGTPFAVDLGVIEAVDDAIQKTRDALASPQRSDYKALAAALDERIFRPLVGAIGDATDVFIAPDRALNLLPFEALYDESGRPRIDRYRFTYLTSGRDLLGIASRGKARGAAFVLANPDFDAAPSRDSAPKTDEAPSPATASRGVELLARARFPALGGTAKEGTRVAEELPNAELVTGRFATKDAFFGLHGPAVVHIATHGFFLPASEDVAAPNAAGGVTSSFDNPLLRSGLAFSGANQAGDKHRSILTALEAAGLDLEGTRLVTLSACETGLGDATGGDGVYGLRRALVMAGAETTVMSLWKVNDLATRDMMIAFYGRLRAGEGASEALRQARLELKTKPGREHPHYWASFIVSGDPSPIVAGGLKAVAPPAAPPASRGCACDVPAGREPFLPELFALSLGALALAARLSLRPRGSAGGIRRLS